MSMDLPVCPLVVDDRLVRNMLAKPLTLKTVAASKGESKALGSLLGRRGVRLHEQPSGRDHWVFCYNRSRKDTHNFWQSWVWLFTCSHSRMFKGCKVHSP